VNIQVSIRIGSPGDNGAVTQVNDAGNAAPPVRDDNTDRADTSGSSGGSGDIGRDITGTAGDSTSEDPTQDSGCEPNSVCCDVSILVSVCLDTGTGVLFPQDLIRLLEVIFENTSLNADDTGQYQDDPVQYRPINISVSIRISSPGNDGPVVQTNLVHVQASVAVEGDAAGQLPVPLDATVVPFDATVGLASADGDVAGQEPVAGETESVVDAFVAADIQRSTPTTQDPMVLDSPFPLSAGSVSRGLDAISRLAWGGGRQPPVAWFTTTGSPGASDETARTAGARSARRRHSRAAAPPAPPAHPWIPVAFSAAPASASSGGSGGGGGLAIALSLPFVLALLYSGFRRLRTSVSVPSAHISRKPERPG
jgi:hypothetical protein